MNEKEEKEEGKMKFLQSKEELNKNLLKLIEESTSRLQIISPYINFQYKGDDWDTMIDSLKTKKAFLEIYVNPHNKISNGTDGKEETVVDHVKRYEIVNEQNLFLVESLHSKIYISEKSIILSSMNLIFSSFMKSIDYGVLVDRNNKEYDKIVEYCNKYICYNNKNIIVKYFKENGINIDINDGDDMGTIFLESNEGYVRCNINPSCDSSEHVLLYFEVIKNSKPLQIKRSQIENVFDVKWSDYSNRHYWVLLEKNEYAHLQNLGQHNCIGYINMTGKRLLGELIKLYRHLDE